MTRHPQPENRCHGTLRKTADFRRHGTAASGAVPEIPVKNDVQTITCDTTGAAALSCLIPKTPVAGFNEFLRDRTDYWRMIAAFDNHIQNEPISGTRNG
jgi:hypothetical protein